jgi:hypothetical protein
MSEFSEQNLEAVVRKIISQTTGKGSEVATGDTSEPKLSDLKHKIDNLLQPPPKFQRGDVVTWKKGLKNKKYPKEGQLAVVIEQLDQPVIQGERDSGSPYFHEPLDLILGLLDQGGDLMLFHYDKRRFEIVK